MEHTEDVERLFSWLKAPMVHYRDFAPQTEIAEAVATWPSVYKAAVQTGVAVADETAPHGDVAARERIARERRTLPAAVARAIEQTPPETPAAPPPPADSRLEERPSEGRLGDRPSDGRLSDRPGDRLAAGLGQRVEAARVEPTAPSTEGAAPTVPRDIVEPVMEGFEAPPARPEPHESYDGEPVEAARPYPARERAGLFAGEYRGRERSARPGNRVADRQDRSLDAVFSRLSGARDRPSDPRARARTSPGLGTVFGRLR
jgi:hypothetical protein